MMKIQTFTQALPRRDEWTVGQIERVLLDGLPGCERLLRWAIVQAGPEALHCEGAYLRVK